jgi:hypothetical protein
MTAIALALTLPGPAVELGTARGIRLSAVQDDAGPCLLIRGLPGGTRACGRPPGRAAIRGDAIVRRRAPAPLELYGAASAAVGHVVVRYRLPDGTRGQRRATLIRVDDRAALAKARIGRPFGYFLAAVPRRAGDITAVAPGATFDFDGIARSMHPTVFIAHRDP